MIFHYGSIEVFATYCFDQAIEQLNKDSLTHESKTLIETTVYLLRHAGIFI